MNAERANAELVGSRFGRVEWLERTTSTNTVLMERARTGAPEQVLVADEQTAGRGRLARTWVAPPAASLLCSILVRQSDPTRGPSLVTMALGVAAAEACDQVAGARLGLKWPNDLVAVGVGTDGSDRKVSGLLAESVVTDGVVRAVVAGIGINVNWPDPLPDDLGEIATSLRHLSGHAVDRVDLLVALIRRFEHHLDRPDDLLDEYRDRSATLGRRVRVIRSDGETTGRAVDLEPDGALVVEAEPDGRRLVVRVGDIVHLRHG